MLAVAVLAAVAAWQHERVLGKVLYWRYWQTLETPRLPPAADAAQARRDDLDFLARLPEVDRSFTDATRAELARRLSALRGRVGELDEAAFLLGVAHAVAAAGNGHTGLDPAHWRERLASVPVRLAWSGDALVVVRAREDHAFLLGARVLAIAGEDPLRLLAASAPYLSGTPERARALSPSLLESPAVIASLRPDASAEALALRVRDAMGAEREVRLAALPPPASPVASRPGRVIAPEAIRGESGWRTWIAAEATPVTLRGAEADFHSATLSPGVLYLHPWRVSRGFDASIGRALDAALGADDAAPWRRIVLDLRLNDGGEYPMVHRALSRLPRRLAQDGRLDILTDETTYSGAIIMAALARHFVGQRSRVVGTRAGDGLAFWAEGTRVVLPRSGLRVHVATGFHDWANGCRAWRCYWPNLLRGVAVGSIEPAVPAVRDPDALARGTDTVLAAALE